jgi:ABC-type lipoprotein export system ATPase subunit
MAGEIAIRTLNEVGCEIEPASFLSFVGPSGSGKTTILNQIGARGTEFGDKQNDYKFELRIRYYF